MKKITFILCLFASTLFAQLPVELTTFDVTSAGRITWTTQSEVSFSHFEIETRTDNKRWHVAKRIDGRGTPAQYEIRITLPAGNNYVRLRMVDVDGSVEYSDIEHVFVTAPHAVHVIGNMLYVTTPTDFFYPVYMYNVQLNRLWLFTPRGAEAINLVNMPAGLYSVSGGARYPWFPPFKFYKAQ